MSFQTVPKLDIKSCFYCKCQTIGILLAPNQNAQNFLIALQQACISRCKKQYGLQRSLLCYEIPYILIFGCCVQYVDSYLGDLQCQRSQTDPRGSWLLGKIASGLARLPKNKDWLSAGFVSCGSWPAQRCASRHSIFHGHADSNIFSLYTCQRNKM